MNRVILYIDYSRIIKKEFCLIQCETLIGRDKRHPFIHVIGIVLHQHLKRIFSLFLSRYSLKTVSTSLKNSVYTHDIVFFYKTYSIVLTFCIEMLKQVSLASFLHKKKIFSNFVLRISCSCDVHENLSRHKTVRSL